ncbi:MAG: hypothetical protein ACE3K5_28885 [Candidatus Pristimantibacillus sp.]
MRQSSWVRVARITATGIPTGTFRMNEDHDISWNFWTWEKLDCTNSPYSVCRSDGWQLLIDYLEGGKKPDADTAERILWLSNCEYQPHVSDECFIPAACCTNPGSLLRLSGCRR